MAPPPKRHRGGLEKEDNDLRKEIESLKEVIEMMREEISNLKSQIGTNKVPMTYKDSLGTSTTPDAAPQVKEVPLNHPPTPTKTSSMSQEGWKEIPQRRSKEREKQRKKQPQGPLPAAKESLKESLDSLNKEGKLRVLLRKPKRTEDRSAKIEVIPVSLPLSARAQAQPMVAWKQALETLTGHRPLSVSLIHPCKGEIFVDSSVQPVVTETLRKEGYLVETHQVLEKDLERRKQAYLRGYFLPLRRAALTGFTPDLQLKLLDLAEASLLKLPNPTDRKQWKFQIAKDRSWVQKGVGDI
jgi:hypothetical protein